MAHLRELIVASAEQDVCLQPTDWIHDCFATGSHGKLKKKCICKRGITTRERNEFQTLSFKKKNMYQSKLVFFHSSASVKLRYHCTSWWLRFSAFPVLSREFGNNCAAWHIPCSASLLPSSLFRPVLSSAKRFKYYSTASPFRMLRQIDELDECISVHHNFLVRFLK